MTTIAIEQLPEGAQSLLRAALRDDDALITEHGQPIARVSRLGEKALLPEATDGRQHRRAGGAGALIVYMSPDFDEPVDDFGDL